jgi:hypothetical protein
VYDLKFFVYNFVLHADWTYLYTKCMTLDPTCEPRLRLSHIEEAARVIDPVFRDTPQFVADSLGAHLGLRLVCKVETANPVRSFKGRGADYFVHRLESSTTTLVCVLRRATSARALLMPLGAAR